MAGQTFLQVSLCIVRQISLGRLFNITTNGYKRKEVSTYLHNLVLQNKCKLKPLNFIANVQEQIYTDKKAFTTCGNSTFS